MDDDAVDAAGKRGDCGLADGDVRRALQGSAGSDAKTPYVLAEARVASVLGEDAEILERLSGAELSAHDCYEGPIFPAGIRPVRARASRGRCRSSPMSS